MEYTFTSKMSRHTMNSSGSSGQWVDASWCQMKMHFHVNDDKCIRGSRWNVRHRLDDERKVISLISHHLGQNRVSLQETGRDDFQISCKLHQHGHTCSITHEHMQRWMPKPIKMTVEQRSSRMIRLSRWRRCRRRVIFRWILISITRSCHKEVLTVTGWHAMC